MRTLLGNLIVPNGLCTRISMIRLASARLRSRQADYKEKIRLVTGQDLLVLFVLLGGHIRLEVTVEKLNGVEAVYQREYKDLDSEPAKVFTAKFEEEVHFSEIFVMYYINLTVLQEHFFVQTEH